MTIEKLGTVDINMVETTPLIFNNTLLRVEAVRSNYPNNNDPEKRSYFRIKNVNKNMQVSPNFAFDYAFASAFVRKNNGVETIYMYGTNYGTPGIHGDHV